MNTTAEKAGSHDRPARDGMLVGRNGYGAPR